MKSIEPSNLNNPVNGAVRSHRCRSMPSTVTRLYSVFYPSFLMQISAIPSGISSITRSWTALQIGLLPSSLAFAVLHFTCTSSWICIIFDRLKWNLKRCACEIIPGVVVIALFKDSFQDIKKMFSNEKKKISAESWPKTSHCCLIESQVSSKPFTYRNLRRLVYDANQIVLWKAFPNFNIWKIDDNLHDSPTMGGIQNHPKN